MKCLWKDLDFSAFFEMKSKSFYPNKPIRVPQDVDLRGLAQSTTVNADFLIFGNVQTAGTVQLSKLISTT